MEFEMTKKEQILKLIESLPETVSIEDVMYELYVKDKVDRGLADAEAGRTHSHEEIQRDVAKWLAK